MDHVFLAVFETEQAATDARRRLLSAGFGEDAVTMTDSGASGLTVRVTNESELRQAEQVLEAAGGSAETLPVVEEQLAVGKRTVSRGQVRVSSRIVEAPAQETVHLRQEEARVDRRAADRPATEADFAAFEEGVLEVREMIEEAVVSKTARVVAEVEVSKRITGREEVVRDTLRRTQVDVERVEPGPRGSRAQP